MDESTSDFLVPWVPGERPPTCLLMAVVLYVVLVVGPRGDIAAGDLSWDQPHRVLWEMVTVRVRLDCSSRKACFVQTRQGASGRKGSTCEQLSFTHSLGALKRHEWKPDWKKNQEK